MNMPIAMKVDQEKFSVRKRENDFLFIVCRVKSEIHYPLFQLKVTLTTF